MLARDHGGSGTPLMIAAGSTTSAPIISLVPSRCRRPRPSAMARNTTIASENPAEQDQPTEVLVDESGEQAGHAAREQTDRAEKSSGSGLMFGRASERRAYLGARVCERISHRVHHGHHEQRSKTRDDAVRERARNRHCQADAYDTNGSVCLCQPPTDRCEHDHGRGERTDRDADQPGGRRRGRAATQPRSPRSARQSCRTPRGRTTLPGSRGVQAVHGALPAIRCRLRARPGRGG